MISIVVPTFNEEGNIEALFKEVNKYLSNEPFEIIFVNDGSSDKSLSIVKKLVKKHSTVKYVSFSRNFGHQSALRAGLSKAKGDAVISMDADLQHPAKLLPELVNKWREGYDIVYTRRNDTQADLSFFKKVSSAGFYKFMNWMSGLAIDPGAADFRLLDKKVVEVINTFPEPDLFLRGLVNWVGFRNYAIDYTPAKRFAGKSKYSLKKMINLGLNGMTQFSIKPLRLTILVGFLMALAALLYAFYTMWAYFVGNEAVTGWTSLIIVILLTSGIQIMLLGVVGEYVGRTFMQTKNRPDYIVGETNVE